jgi:5'-3' exonuclease
MNTLILIDTSYTIFYRFFATIRWYSLANKEEYQLIKNDTNYNWYDNKIFIEKYEKMFLEAIIKLIKKKTFYSPNSYVLFCLDTPKEHLWRMKIQCDYKSNRIMKTCDATNIKLFFNYTYTIIIPNLIKTYKNINQLQISNIEADDIIGVICLYIKNKDLNYKIYLISSDNDFYQLGFKNLSFINYKSKKELILSIEEAKYELNKKILFGDKSDCIPSIIKKRIKNKIELLENENILLKYLNDNPESKKQYEINKKMIDFNNIPSEYYNKIINIFTTLI